MNTQIDTTSGYASNFFHQIINGLPRFLGAMVVLVIGIIIAKVIAKIINKALEKVRLDERVHAGKGGNIIQRAIPSPSMLISNIAYYLIALFVLSIAVSMLGIPALMQIVHGIYAYIPNVIAAILIFLVAGAVSAGAANLVVKTMGDTPTGKIAATAVPVLVMGIAVFMILNQLKIAPEIVTITYAGLVATATLAFGLGGKDAASKLFLSLYDAGQKHKDTALSDIKKGSAEAKHKAQQLQQKAAQQQ